MSSSYVCRGGMNSLVCHTCMFLYITFALHLFLLSFLILFLLPFSVFRIQEMCFCGMLIILIVRAFPNKMFPFSSLLLSVQVPAFHHISLTVGHLNVPLPGRRILLSRAQGLKSGKLIGM